MTEKEVDEYIRSVLADVCGDDLGQEIDNFYNEFPAPVFNPELGIYE